MSREVVSTVYSFAELIALADDPDSSVTDRAVERVRQTLAEWATCDSWWHECTTDEWAEALAHVGFENAEIAFSGFASQGDGASFTADCDAAKLIAFLSTPTEAGPHDTSDLRPRIVSQVRGGIGTDARFAKLAELDEWFSLGGIVRREYRYSHEGTCAVECDVYEYAAEAEVASLREELAELMSQGDSLLDADEESQDAHVAAVADLERRIAAIVEGIALVNAFVEAVEELRSDLCSAIYRALEAEYEYRVSDEALIEDDEANGYEWTADGYVA